MPRPVASWLALLALLAQGCAETGSAPDAGESCRIGEAFRCDCPGAVAGTQLCLQDGSLGACLCPASALAGCQPGEVLGCRCDDGRSGEQVCLAGGGLSGCQCTGVPRVVAPPALDEPALEPPAVPAPPSAPPQRCCSDLGSCLPAGLIPAEAAQLLSSDRCRSEDTLCVPDALSEPDGARLQPCRGLGAAEGRCMPACLPDVQTQKANLVRDLCPQRYLCVPCHDPYSGEPSGACEIGADPGPSEEPVPFGSCCDGVGSCVPAQLVPESERALLPVDDCDAARGLLCAPDALLDPDAVVLQSCRALGDLEGRCLAECLLTSLGVPGGLEQSDCPGAHACVPCFDPFTGAASGVCGIGDDPGPAEPPTVYARCCDVSANTLGTCLPSSVLPPEAAALPQDSCAVPTDRCVPDSILDDPSGGFPRCSTLFGGAGGCLPECMIPNTQFLIQGICDEGALCVPCTAQGQPTGACLAP